MHMYSIAVKDYFQAAGPGSARIPSGGPSVAIKFSVKPAWEWNSCWSGGLNLLDRVKKSKVWFTGGSTNRVSTVIFIKIQDPPAGVRFVSESEWQSPLDHVRGTDTKMKLSEFS